jgi:hypothetical protein
LSWPRRVYWTSSGSLMKRKPLFHRRELVNSREDVERETADDLWEIGASSRRYGRECVWATLMERVGSSDMDHFELEQWQTRDLWLREIAPADLRAALVVGPRRPADPAVDLVAELH